MSQAWQAYALHVLDAIEKVHRIEQRNILIHNYLGDIDPLAIHNVIDKHLYPPEQCMKAMLADDV
jgi:hypothetical protein